MERYTVFKTDKERYSVRPIDWEGIWYKKGRIKENGLNHTGIFAEKEDAEFFAKSKNAEEQGKLMILPCKPGDALYTIYQDENCCFVEKMIITEVTNKRVLCENQYWYSYSKFGKTVFLTEKEVKKALEGMKK